MLLKKDLLSCTKIIIRRNKLILRSLIQENFYVCGLLFTDFMLFLIVLSRLIQTNFTVANIQNTY